MDEPTYVYICYTGIDYEGETIDRVFDSMHRAEAWDASHPRGDYQGYWVEEVHQRYENKKDEGANMCRLW